MIGTRIRFRGIILRLVLTGLVLLGGFSGAAAAEPGGLSVVAEQPGAGATGVDPLTTISVRFSGDLDDATVSTETVELKNDAGLPVIYGVEYVAVDRRVVILPFEGLLNGATYRVSLKNGIKDQQGNTLGTDYEWSFTVRPDGLMPVFEDYRYCAKMAAKGERLAWLQKVTGGEYGIFAARLATGRAVNIVPVAAGITTPEVNLTIDRDMVAWAVKDGEQWHLQAKNLVTGEQWEIAAGLSREPLPDICGSRLVYVASTGNGDIRAYDLATGIEKTICADPLEQTAPRVSGDYVVWVDKRAGNEDVYYRHLRDGRETALATGPSAQGEPDIWEDTVVWRDARIGGCGIYYQVLSRDKAPRPLFDDLAFYRSMPRVWGNQVVWQCGTGNGIYIKEIGPAAARAVYVGTKGKNAVALNATRVFFLDDQETNNIYGVDTTGREQLVAVEVYPNPGSQGVRPDEKFFVKFSTGVAPATVNPDTFFLTVAATGEKVAATISFDPDGGRYLLQPVNDLKPDTRYTVTATAGVTNNAGLALTPKSWSFQTAGEREMPVSIETNYTHTYPAIYANNVVWVVNDQFLCGYNRKDGYQVLFSALAMPYPPRIFGDRAVVAGLTLETLSGDIFLVDINTGEATPVCTDMLDQYLPNIYGDQVLWVEKTTGDLQLKNLETGEVRTLATGIKIQKQAPSIWRNTVAWSAPVAGTARIHVRDLLTGNTIVDQGDGNQDSPQVWQDRIVWIEAGNLWAGRLSAGGIGQKQRLSAVPSAYIYNPFIYGDNVVWHEKRNGQDYDVFLYNLVAGREQALIARPGDQYVWGIFGDRVVWSEGWDMAYVTRFTDLSPDTGSPTVPAGVRVDAGGTGRPLVSWDRAVDDREVTVYVVERSVDGRQWTGAGRAYEYGFGAGRRVQFCDRDAEAGREYYYRVVAGDAAGNWSAASETVRTTVAGRQLNLTLAGGGNQSQAAGGYLAEPLVFKVSDQYNRPVPGVTVKLAVLTGPGMVDGGEKTTSEAGTVQFQVRVAGGGMITLAGSLPADSGCLPLNMNILGIDDTYGLTGNGGDGQGGPFGEPLSQPFSVVLSDAAGGPVAGVAVKFRFTAGAGALAPGSAPGEPAGELTVVSDAGGMAGVYCLPGFGRNEVEAVVTGLNKRVVFAAEGTAAAMITGVVGNYGELYRGRGYGDLEVYSVDDQGNPGPVCVVDDQGRFAFPAREGVWKAGLRIGLAEYGAPIPLVLPAPRELPVSSGNVAVSFMLVPATVKVTGRVTDEAGIPFRFASGTALPANIWASSLQHPLGPVVSLKRQIDDAGNFEVYLPPGSYSLGCWVYGHMQPPERRIEVTAAGVAGDTWFKVPQGAGEIIGHTFGPAGRLPGVLVTAWSPRQGLVYDYSRQEPTAGLYFVSVPAGCYEVRAFHPELGEMAVSPDTPDNPVEVTAAGGAGKYYVDFVPQYRVGSLQGKVYREGSGEPVGGVVVNACNPVSKVRKSTRTNVRGEYRIELPVAAEPYALELWHKELGRVVAGQGKIELNRVTVKDFRLPAACRVCGVVTTGGTLPLAGVMVGALALAGGEYTGTETAPDGSFRFSLRPGERYRLTVWAAGFAEQTTEIIAADGIVQDFDFVARQVISGLVWGNQGTGSAGLANVWVEAWSPAGKSYGAFTGPDGKFTISLPAGTYTILAAKPGWAQKEVFTTAAQPADPAAIKVEMAVAGRLVRGMAADPGGKPVPFAQVWVENAKGDIFATRTDERGCYTLPAYPDAWKLYAVCDRMSRAGPFPVNLAGGDVTTDITFTHLLDMVDPGLAVIKTDQGGIVTDPENGMALVIPPGNAGMESEITIVTTKNTALVPTRNYKPVVAYDFRAVTTKGAMIKDILTQNMEARIRYTATDLRAAGIGDNSPAEQNLRVAYFDGAAGNWVEVPAVHDSRDPDAAGGGVFIVRANHFTEFSIVEPTAMIMLGFRGGDPGESGIPGKPAVETKPLPGAPEQAVGEVPAVFSDLAGHWAEETVLSLAQKGIIKGIGGQALPDALFTRAQFAALLVNVCQLPPRTGELPFRDAVPGAWYTQPLFTAYSHNLINGYSPEAIGPDDALTREQLAVLLDRAASRFPVRGKNTASAPESLAPGFADTEEISPWARAAVTRLWRQGHLGGFPDGTFRPGRPVTRAEGFVLLAGMFIVEN